MAQPEESRPAMHLPQRPCVRWHTLCKKREKALKADFHSAQDRNIMAEVLLVDDDGSVLLTTTIALRRYGHNVTAAHDAWQALTMLARQPYEVLVSDVRMPGMSGLELAARARALETPPHVILTSAQCSEIEDGVAELFLPKPVDTDELNDLLSLLGGELTPLATSRRRGTARHHTNK
jgi:CheY-like chemotaxis protein